MISTRIPEPIHRWRTVCLAPALGLLLQCVPATTTTTPAAPPSQGSEALAAAEVRVAETEVEVEAQIGEEAEVGFEYKSIAVALNTTYDGSPCEDYKQDLLKEPNEIYPVENHSGTGTLLETQLVVAIRPRCVPVWHVDPKDATKGSWRMEKLKLRTYGHPAPGKTITEEMARHDLDSRDIIWTAPGPTMVLNKADQVGASSGTRYKLTLFNSMPVQASPHTCNELKKDPDFPGAVPSSAPNCFHGDNSTNYHLHGSHVSPQAHQDYVSLELLPFGASVPTHGTHSRGDVAVGTYKIDIDPLRYSQAEGSHWYHAHKHGATALQVINGLVGTLKILGEFDRELAEPYELGEQGELPDRVMVIQQLAETLVGMGNTPNSPPPPLINGQANPIVVMRPGEVQRWRLIGATMNDTGTMRIGFPEAKGQPTIKQVAMDGVQFSPENYRCQPILNGPDCEPNTADDAGRDTYDLQLAPGNRIDVLVQAPQRPGVHPFTYEVAGHIPEARREAMDQLLKSLPKDRESAEPVLLTVRVEGTSVTSSLPTESDFPRMPAFLANIPKPRKSRTLAYQMANQNQLYDQGDKKGVVFGINGHAYRPECVDETLELDRAEEITLTNDSSIAHPFHIHTNPFQVMSEGGVPYEYPFWRDTLPIPTASSDGKSLGKAVIRYVAKEFTGEFVNHCHILGHEDRGMMQNVQSTCANGKWGHPNEVTNPAKQCDASGFCQTECVAGNYSNSQPGCSKTGAAR